MQHTGNVFKMVFPQSLLLFVFTCVTFNPTVEQILDVCGLWSVSVKITGAMAKHAMLCFQNHGRRGYACNVVLLKSWVPLLSMQCCASKITDAVAMQYCASEITGAVAMLPKSRVPWLCMQSMLCFTVKPDQQRTLNNCNHEEKIVRDCIYQL